MTGTNRSPRKSSATTDDPTESTDTAPDADDTPEFSGRFHWLEWHLKQALDARLPKIVWYPLYELSYGIPVFILAFIFYLIWWPVKYTAIVWVPLLALGAFMLVCLFIWGENGMEIGGSLIGLLGLIVFIKIAANSDGGNSAPGDGTNYWRRRAESYTKWSIWHSFK